MSAPKVDVLAVMDADAVAASARRSNAVQPANVNHDESDAAWHSSREARAAVAELIDAANASLQARPGGAQISANLRLMSALARIGGAE